MSIKHLLIEIEKKKRRREGSSTWGRRMGWIESKERSSQSKR